jgi:ParB family chromosome partitioning protein
MGTRKALGRGLSALIPNPKPEVATGPLPAAGLEPDAGDASGAPLYVPIDRIVPNPRQPRRIFDEAEIDSLAASIREHGVLQPLVLRSRGEGYELIIGERRWRASQRAGLSEVPAVVLDATDRSVLEMAVVENVQRADLNPIELAEAFRVLVEEEDMTQEDVGRRVGLDRSSVANHLRLLELPADIQQDLASRTITLGHAKAILQAPPSQRPMVRDQIVRSGLSVRGSEELSRSIASKSSPRKSRPGPSRDVHVVDLEDRLRREVRTRVRIIGKRDRGRIELHYFGEGELNRLADLLLGGVE